MKIGIYGGSFNPIHLGHEKIVHFVLETLKLDKIIIVPVGVPSHRENNLEDSNIRLEICKKVFEEFDKIEVSDIEIKAKGKSYTYDTLLKIIEIYGKEHSYYEIIGEDSLNYFHTWKNYKKILELSKIVVLRRKYEKNMKVKQENILFNNSEQYNLLKDGENNSNFNNESDRLNLENFHREKVEAEKKNLFEHKNIILLENPFYDISSTEIRRKIKNNEDISNLVNEKIINIILKEMLDNV